MFIKFYVPLAIKVDQMIKKVLFFPPLKASKFLRIHHLIYNKKKCAIKIS
jgi:hypothetical protein